MISWLQKGGTLKTTKPELPTFDLTALKLRAEEKLGWPSSKIDREIKEYLRFLALHKIHPYKTIYPSAEVDEIWHLHILDTRAYHRVCSEYFGYFLHHDPNPTGDHGDIFVTRKLYEETFGQPMPAVTHADHRVDYTTCR